MAWSQNRSTILSRRRSRAPDQIIHILSTSLYQCQDHLASGSRAVQLFTLTARLNVLSRLITSHHVSLGILSVMKVGFLHKYRNSANFHSFCSPSHHLCTLPWPCRTRMPHGGNSQFWIRQTGEPRTQRKEELNGSQTPATQRRSAFDNGMQWHSPKL